ncbi:sugar transferase [Sediminicoccus sp. KRV36]|uniref:sugar transferase n=1 Tax=Sediminicoccus sp. KRV36 TaxID=3133721 RepID=UPI00200F2D8E|nr:sugar transferase [Sediminicoccus rosea]UPY36171.1 sugar transferase [Sediminicoccus rosea]
MYERWGKRGFDVVAAALLLLATLPLLLGTALLVALMLGRPVLFHQCRAGRGGVTFRLVKFRSMRTGTAPDAARLTRFGRAIRALALDELPQLWLVLRGEMSLVGPRPLPPGYTPFYTAREATRLALRPGLCGLAQAAGRNAVPWAQRLEWDARYVTRITLLGDVAIMLRCLWVVLRGQGVHAAGEATMPPLTSSRAGPSPS